MKLKIYQIDAFADKVFSGNPAAVIPLEQWLDDELMQTIAGENNLSETVFFVGQGSAYHIRWFTPTKEVSLCGHATLAAAFVLFECLQHQGDKIVFESLSGPLSVTKESVAKEPVVKEFATKSSVTKNQYKFTLDFPVQMPEKCDLPDVLQRGLGGSPVECWRGEDYIVVYESEAEVAALTPDLQALMQAQLRGVIVTARSEQYDFVMRFFAPKYGIAEDPVTRAVPYKSA